MQEAIDKGIYNVSSYSSLKNDPEGYNKTIVQEFVYWFVSAEWNYFEVMGKSVNGSWEGGSNEEWSLLTSQEVEEKLPLIVNDSVVQPGDSTLSEFKRLPMAKQQFIHYQLRELEKRERAQIYVSQFGNS